MVKESILDVLFNGTSQAFIAKSIAEGMYILDIGCGTGAMSCWLAKQVGPKGKILAIDNNQTQLMRAKVKAEYEKLFNIEFSLISVYDVSTLKQHFDLVYCRFVLNYLQYPTRVIESAFELLKPGGYFVIEEGIASSAFSYPYNEAWGVKRWYNHISMDDMEGVSQDNNLGMKLVQKMANVGLKVQDINLVQPVLYTQKQKELLLDAIRNEKQSLLENQKHAIDWDDKLKELSKLTDDPTQYFAFYQSCQVRGIKPHRDTSLKTVNFLLKTVKISDLTTIIQCEIGLSPHAIEKLLIEATLNYQKHSAGLYAVMSKNSEQLLGVAGFEFPLIENYIEAVLTIRLSKQYETPDILMELAVFLKEYAFNSRAFMHFSAILDPLDALMTSMLMHIGMSYKKNIFHNGKQMHLYSIRQF